jgi:hypothetical protein
MKNFWIRVAVAAMIAMLGTMGAFAQLTSAAQTITLNAQVNESLTVSPASGSYNFGVVNPGTQFNGPGTTVAITTDYRLSNTRNNVRLCAYFASAASAMSAPGDNIPSSAIQVRGTTLVPTFTGINGTCGAGFGVAGASLTLANYAVGPSSRHATHNENLEFNLDLSTLPDLTAGAYTGNLNVQAQATP